MASPQLENGYTKISNELLEALEQQELPGTLWRILLCIIRKTYGYSKKVDYLTNSQIAKDTKLSKVVVARALKLLAKSHYIVRPSLKHVGIQKDYEQWNSKLAKQVTLKVNKLANKKLPNQLTELPNQLTKVTYPTITQKKKETNTKEKKERGNDSFNSSFVGVATPTTPGVTSSNAKRGVSVPRVKRNEGGLEKVVAGSRNMQHIPPAFDSD